MFHWFKKKVRGGKMMQNIKWAFEKSKTGVKDERYQAYHDILNATDQEVTWAYEVWDQLLEDLTHKDNHQRSRAAQYLAGLAKSDPGKRIMTDYPQLWAVVTVKYKWTEGLNKNGHFR